MGKYKTNPCEIEAIQWTGNNSKEILDFCKGQAKYNIIYAAWKVDKGPAVQQLIIHTLEGDMKASVNDYIIRGLNGEYYPCKPDIFEKKYSPINNKSNEFIEYIVQKLLRKYITKIQKELSELKYESLDKTRYISEDQITTIPYSRSSYERYIYYEGYRNAIKHINHILHNDNEYIESLYRELYDNTRCKGEC